MALALNQVGKAVLMAALTTIFGFGTITYSDYPGLISMGVACVLGVGTCAVASLILLPAVLLLWGRSGDSYWSGSPPPGSRL